MTYISEELDLQLKGQKQESFYNTTKLEQELIRAIMDKGNVDKTLILNVHYKYTYKYTGEYQLTVWKMNYLHSMVSNIATIWAIIRGATSYKIVNGVDY